MPSSYAGCGVDDPSGIESPSPTSGSSSPRDCKSRRCAKSPADGICEDNPPRCGHRVIFSPEVMEQLRIDAERLGKINLIGHVAGEHPTLDEIQDWINQFLVKPELYPEIQVNQVCMLERSYFTITFVEKAGADKALKLSPINCNNHIMFLHSWTPNFNPPPGESVAVWVVFPGLPRIYYPYLDHIASTLGRVVWQGEKSASLQRGCPPKIRVLVADVLKLPGVISIPLAMGDGYFEQIVSYEGKSKQICSKCKSLTISVDE